MDEGAIVGADIAPRRRRIIDMITHQLAAYDLRLSDVQKTSNWHSARATPSLRFFQSP
ncbi:hypothetical protein [Rhizorhabdus wittichii]